MSKAAVSKQEWWSGGPLSAVWIFTTELLTPEIWRTREGGEQDRETRTRQTRQIREGAPGNEDKGNRTGEGNHGMATSEGRPVKREQGRETTGDRQSENGGC
jgi:hypothetical protein